MKKSNCYNPKVCDFRSRGHWETENCKSCTQCIDLEEDPEDEMYFCRDNGTCCGHVQCHCLATDSKVTLIGDCQVQQTEVHGPSRHEVLF